ncbi:MAG TPA: arsenite methyltransferase [Candidatus Aminicenantes bacterium]|nr:arsenite methyltransferase [Candidatus Aminicenantes bacterium]HRY63915.1 arsenite methyltransferase [Candidatus Aminicenantes bacterium]HRZ70828.1 arsenite methyltransferase [Candidatus Aminicenantes bacterium]
MKVKDTEIKKHVRDRYARAAKESSSCCGKVSSPCCGGTAEPDRDAASRMVGYSPEDLAAIPEDANLGLGCGNPTALAGLKPGETVLDLGSGGGIDCFLAARKVGPSGRVIGVDMTAEMVDRARENARRTGAANVEFRLGEIESLPVADGTVDVIISNCVINLSTDKPRVFREAFRVLKPGGRIMVSDLALRKPLPEAVRASVDAYVACVAGALVKDEYLRDVSEAGFERVEVVNEKAFPAELILEDSLAGEAVKKLKLSLQELREHIGSVLSLEVSAVKPGR